MGGRLGLVFSNWHRGLQRQTVNLGAQRAVIAAGTDRLTDRIDHLDTHAQMVFQLHISPGIVIQPHTGHARQLAAERLGQAAVGKRHALQRGADKVRHRDKVLTNGLWQTTHQRHALVEQQPGHQPVEPLRVDTPQQRSRNTHGHAICRMARLEVIAERQCHTLPAQQIRVQIGADIIGLALQQVIAGHVQQLGIGLAAALEPALETRQLVDVLGDALIKEAVKRFLVHHDIALACLGFQFIQLAEQLLVGLVEGRPAVPLACHQRLANKQFARDNRINRAEVHLALWHDDQAVQRDLLKGHDLTALFLPVRLAVTGLDQMRRQRLDPHRINLCRQPTIQTAGFGQLGDHHPGRLFLRQTRGRMQQEAALPCAEIIALLGLVAEVAEQTREQRLVYRLAGRRLFVFIQSHVAAGETNLPMGFAPLTQTQIIQEIATAPAAQLALGQCLTLALKTVPQIQEGGKVRALLVPLGMGLIGCLLLFQRTFARILHSQRAGNHRQLGQAALTSPFQQHPTNARINRQARQLATDISHCAAAINRAQFLQQGETVADGPAIRRLDKREILDAAKAQMQHLQNDRGQVGAANLRVGELRASEEVFLAEQSHTDTGGNPAAPALALVGTGLRDSFHRQPLHLGARTVAADARLARVNHINDARHRQRGFRHVGCQHHTPPGMGGKNLLLFGSRQPRIQRQNLGVLQVGLAQVLGGIANLPLARQKHQHVTRRLALTALKLLNLGQRGNDALVDAEVFLDRVALFVPFGAERPIPDIHRVGTTGHFNHRRIVEMGREPLKINGCRGDDHLQIRPLGQDGLEVTQQEIDIEAALVRLVDDQGVIAGEVTVILGFGQQNAVGHQLDQRAL